MSNKESMVESLHTGVCQVTFEKVDGTKRVMNCTLNQSYLPQTLNESETKRETNAKDEHIRKMLKEMVDRYYS